MIVDSCYVFQLRRASPIPHWVFYLCNVAIWLLSLFLLYRLLLYRLWAILKRRIGRYGSLWSGGSLLLIDSRFLLLHYLFRLNTLLHHRIVTHFFNFPRSASRTLDWHHLIDIVYSSSGIRLSIEFLVIFIFGQGFAQRQRLCQRLSLQLLSPILLFFLLFELSQAFLF